MTTEEFKCPICPHSYDKLISLSLHYRKGHHKTAKNLYVDYYFSGVEPVCQCGCGEKTRFLDISRGFSRFVYGHAVRVHNNWGHNPEALAKSQKTRREMIENGCFKPFHLKETGEHWAKGLTKDTDESIARMSETIKNNPEEIQRRTERMRDGRLNGSIPTLYGSGHSQWRGGISPLGATCRADSKLYKEWKYPILVEADFKCQNCESTKKLEVHHDKETFSDILRRFAKEYGWEENLATHTSFDAPELFELKMKISESIVEYHINNNISGKVLCEVCHDSEHTSHKDED